MQVVRRALRPFVRGLRTRCPSAPRLKRSSDCPRLRSELPSKCFCPDADQTLTHLIVAWAGKLLLALLGAHTSPRSRTKNRDLCMVVVSTRHKCMKITCRGGFRAWQLDAL